MQKRVNNSRILIINGLIIMSVGVALLMTGCRSWTSQLQLASRGQTEYAVIRGAAPTKAEQLAVEELTNYLGKVTGARFTVLSETQDVTAVSGIYVGWTDFAKQQGIDVKTLGEEEWIIRSAGKNLIITGGRLRGTLYGVYEFLENQVGCHWLSWDTEMVPSKPDLTLSSLNLSGRPAFPSCRGIYGRRHGTGIDQCALRNRGQSPWQKDIGGYLALPPGLEHTFYFFVDPRNWFDKHPEYFPMDESGKRFHGEPDGKGYAQLCLSNPDLPKVTADSISRYVKEQDREFAKLGFAKPIRIVNLVQEDNCSFICKCPECKKITEREGSESGLLIQYVNKAAELLSQEYPDIKVRTLAYVSTDKPPLTVRPRDNVIVTFCDLYGKSECYRPLTSNFNQPQADLVRGWSKITRDLQIWDYWNMGSQQSAPGVPELISAETVAGDMRFFRDNHVMGIFSEAEVGVTQQSFYDLSWWAGMQLMDNPDLPEDKLVTTFIDGYYGPAAKPMRDYYDFLAKSMKQEPTPMFTSTGNPITGRKYLTMDFLVRCRELLLEAEAACAPASPEQMHVWREMIVVYNCMLHQWARMKRITGRDFPFSREEILAKYGIMREAVINYQYGDYGRLHLGASLKALMEDLQMEMATFRSSLPLPEQFRNLPEDKVMDFPWTKLPPWALLKDTDAAGGRAVNYADPDPEKHLKAPVFGIYDRPSKRSGPTVTVTNVPGDEKYHVYKLGQFRFGSASYIWGHWSWRLQIYLPSAYIPADGVQSADPNLWDVYVSAKITGPAYVPGSVKTNAIWVDRVILVKPELK